MWFDENSHESRAYAEVTDGHTAKLSHEAIAAAASFEAAKAYEHHLMAVGKPATHAKALELLAGLTGGFVDGMAETKGLDWLDKERAKHEAKERTWKALAESGQY